MDFLLLTPQWFQILKFYQALPNYVLHFSPLVAEAYDRSI